MSFPGLALSWLWMLDKHFSKAHDKPVMVPLPIKAPHAWTPQDACSTHPLAWLRGILAPWPRIAIACMTCLVHTVTSECDAVWAVCVLYVL